LPTRRWLPLILILCAVWIPYGQTLYHERIADDRMLIPVRLDPERVESAAALWGENYWGHLDSSGLYRPVALTLLYGQRVLFGLDHFPYRLMSLVLYSLCGIVCWLLLRRLAGPVAGLAGALLFVAHPAHVEVALTAYGQAEIVAAILTMGALLAYMRDSLRWRLVAAGLLFAALLTKEIAVAFPVLAALTRGIWLRADTQGWRRWFAPADAIFSAVIGVYAVLKFLVIGGLAVPSTASTMAQFTLYRRLYTVFTHGLGNYVRLTIFPESQSMVYDYFSSARADVYWVALSAIFLLLCWRWLGTKPVLYATGWFLATWFVFSNLVVPTGVFVAERCLFLPVFSICFLFGVGADRVWAMPNGAPRLAAITAMALIGCLALAQTIRTADAWRSEEASLRASMEEHPESPLARASLALTLLLEPPAAAPEQEEAEGLLRGVLSRFPAMPEAHRGMGLRQKARGNYADAVGHLRHALELRPRDAMIQSDLAECERLAAGAR